MAERTVALREHLSPDLRAATDRHTMKAKEMRGRPGERVPLDSLQRRTLMNPATTWQFHEDLVILWSSPIWRSNRLPDRTFGSGGLPFPHRCMVVHLHYSLVSD